MTRVVHMSQRSMRRPNPGAPPGSPGDFGLYFAASDGRESIPQEDTRFASAATAVAPVTGTPQSNPYWNGDGTIRVVAVRNHTAYFEVHIDNPTGSTVSGLTAEFYTLNGPSGATITSPAPGVVGGDEVWKWYDTGWTGGPYRRIELFVMRYLPITGLSTYNYEAHWSDGADFDERSTPYKFQRPYTTGAWGWRASRAQRVAGTLWTARAGADKHFPAICEPHEWVTSWSVAAGQSQIIGVDVTIPASQTAGTYTGSIVIKKDGVAIKTLPVQLTVYAIDLPDAPAFPFMTPIFSACIRDRYQGAAYFTHDIYASESDTQTIYKRHWLLGHRHQLAIQYFGGDSAGSANDPTPSNLPTFYLDALKGTLFSTANNYDGPGKDTGMLVGVLHFYGEPAGSVFLVSTSQTQSKVDTWETWLAANAPNCTLLVYLTDEPNVISNSSQAADLNNRLSYWIGVTRTRVKTFVTSHVEYLMDLPNPFGYDCSTVDVVVGQGGAAGWINSGASNLTKTRSLAFLALNARNRIGRYNSTGPAAGSWALEDDSTGLEQACIQHWLSKRDGQGCEQWMNYQYGCTRYYDEGQGNSQFDVWSGTWSNTLGTNGTNPPAADSYAGRTPGGLTYPGSNHDAVLFYPGTDTRFTGSSRGKRGPAAARRLKLMRRGMDAVKLFELAYAVNASATVSDAQALTPNYLDVPQYNDAGLGSWPVYFGAKPWSIVPSDYASKWQALINRILGL